MTEGEDQLPPLWTTAALAQLIAPEGVFVDGDWVESKDQDPNGDVRLIQLADIGDGEFRDRSARFLTSAKAFELRCTFLEAGDLLIARMPDPLGRCCIFPLSGGRRCVTVVDVCIARPGSELIVPKFLMFAINSNSVRSQIAGFQSGSTRKRISRGNLSTVTVPLAPTREQHRIVAKIEELFSELDKAVECLRLARAQLGTYRQALLKAAFEGRLTAEWRAGNPDKLEAPETLLARIRAERDARYTQAVDDWHNALAAWRAGGEKRRKPTRPSRPRDFRHDFTDIEIILRELPHGWAWGRLGFASCGVEYGTAAKSDKVGEVPVIRMGNLQNGLIDWSDLAFTSDKDEIEKYSLTPGDILFNRTNSPELVGKTAIYRGEQPALFAGYLVRVNQIESIVLPEFMCYFLNSHFARKHGDNVKTDGVNQSNINGNKLQEYPFPFCSLDEQKIIVSLLDEKLSAVDSTLADIDDHSSRIAALRQSILKQAFSGRLVLQDPADEPAAALLARLRDASPPARTRRRQTA